MLLTSLLFHECGFVYTNFPSGKRTNLRNIAAYYVRGIMSHLPQLTQNLPLLNSNSMKIFFTAYLSAFLLVLSPLDAAAQTDDVESRPTVTVTDNDINAGDKVRWTADNVYILDGLVIVENGAELKIDAGTVIKANDGTGTAASALVIARGGQIFAEGTPTQPIIFTSAQDNISNDDFLTYEDRGLWGGIVILGHARTNNPGDAEGDYQEIEGVNELVPDGDTRAEYGGDNDDDNSGIIRYASIRHTGINIGESDGNEIQGLTLGGVGSSTVLEYIEVYASGDDGVEFFGGTVNLKYFVSVFNSDDAIDWDQGWRGKGQFWFVLQGTDKAGAAAEQDGAGGDEFFKPYAIPRIYNVTYVGAGSDASPESDRGEMLIFRDNSGGFYHNSIFTQFNTDKGGHAFQIEDIDNTGGKTEDSRQRLEAGDLGLTHNIWWDFGAGIDPISWIASEDPSFVETILGYLLTNENDTVDPELRGIERETMGTGMLDPRPQTGSPAFSNPRADYPEDTFFSPTDYIGAFGKENWLMGWTALDALGYVADSPTSIEEILTEELPSEITLDQNYPNPFNPATTIEFNLDHTQNVTLGVYDLTGRQVALLVNGPKTAGTYRVMFDGSQLTSGLYLYQLQTANQILTRKMMLLK